MATECVCVCVCVCVCEVASMEQYFQNAGTQKIVTKRYRTTEKMHLRLRPPTSGDGF
jgi:hypothetical protein